VVKQPNLAPDLSEDIVLDLVWGDGVERATLDESPLCISTVPVDVRAFGNGDRRVGSNHQLAGVMLRKSSARQIHLRADHAHDILTS
jgi:hypothetical protein